MRPSLVGAILRVVRYSKVIPTKFSRSDTVPLTRALIAHEQVDFTRYINPTHYAQHMGAMGSGDMEKMSALMADDMVWHNVGDETLPWIGGTSGKDNIFKFLGEFTFALRAKVRDGQVVLWHWIEDSFAVSQACHGR